MAASMKMLHLFTIVLVVVVLITGLSEVNGGGECGMANPEIESYKLASCASATQNENAMVSRRCCAQVKRLGKKPQCLCAVMLAHIAKRPGIRPEFAMSIPKRCNIADRPIGYLCGACLAMLDKTRGKTEGPLTQCGCATAASAIVGGAAWGGWSVGVIASRALSHGLGSGGWPLSDFARVGVVYIINHLQPTRERNHHFSCSSTSFDTQIIRRPDPTKDLSPNTGGRSGPQGLEEPTPDEVLRELYDKNYHQLLPLITEKMQKEKEQQDKLNAVKTRLLYGDESRRNLRNHEESHYSESKTPTAKTEPKRRHGNRRSRSPSPVANVFKRLKQNRPPSPRPKSRKEGGVFNRLGGKERSASARSDNRGNGYPTIGPKIKQKRTKPST
ncbi:putative lipid-transfer protein DIR1 [Tanacetum coccineum]